MGDARGEETFEGYVGRGAAGFRRRLIVAAVVAVVAVVAVSAGLAFQQYRHAQRTARNDLRSRAVVAAAVVDAFFGGEVATLEAVANAPAFVARDKPGMRHTSTVSRLRTAACSTAGSAGSIDEASWR